jgi:phosphohistidine phosphatase SixA
MQLFLVRHADSDFGANTDHQRPLSKLGINQAKQSAAYIKQRINSSEINSPGTQIICSDALRTQTTALVIQQHLSPCLLKPDNTYYHARVGDWCDGIMAHQSVENLILVGHNPTLSFLSKHLNPSQAHNLCPSCVLHYELEIHQDGLKLPAQLKDVFKPNAN